MTVRTDATAGRQKHSGPPLSKGTRILLCLQAGSSCLADELAGVQRKKCLSHKDSGQSSLSFSSG